MAASWYLAPSLRVLRDEINQRWPKRDKTSDGTIGDLRHQKAGTSDHNPNDRRSVNAIDIDEDGIDAWWLVRHLIKDSRVYYVIYEGQIWRRKNKFLAERYTGPNSHAHHIHVSIIQSEAAEENTAPWGVTSQVQHKPITTPTTGGLTMSESAAINARLDALTNAIAGKNGTNDKLVHIANLVGSREALNARAAETQAAVRRELAALDVRGAVREAVGQVGSGGVDVDSLADAVVASISKKLGA